MRKTVPPGTLSVDLLVREELGVDDEATDEAGRTPVLFLPDLHLMSNNRGVGYGDFFHLASERKQILLDLLSHLLALRNGDYPFLRIFQLGDLHDLWREAEHWWGEDTLSMLRRQLEDHADLFGLLFQLGVERVAGNHDNALRDAGLGDRLDADPALRLLPERSLHPMLWSFLWGRLGRIDVLHGDQVDPAEGHWYNHVGARLASHGSGVHLGEVDEWKFALVAPGSPDVLAGGIPPQKPVDASDPDATAEQVRFFEPIRSDADGLGAACSPFPRERRLAAVIGHTHMPRIVTDRARPDFVLADCGSWVNRATLASDPGGTWFWNAQVGVLAGRQIGIAQIGR